MELPCRDALPAWPLLSRLAAARPSMPQAIHLVETVDDAVRILSPQA